MYKKQKKKVGKHIVISFIIMFLLTSNKKIITLYSTMS
jgi:hypothetical protein